MDKNVFQLDAQIRAEADDILDQKGLRKTLTSYGTVHVTGSYSLQLMTWRDLDIYVENEEIHESDFFKLGREIANLFQPVKMSYRNERIARTQGLPVGLYWGIYFGDERRGAWKIDVWALNHDECKKRLDYCDALGQKISSEARKKILEIKSQCWTDPHYRKFYTSSDIYTAVLEKHAHDIESFKIYLQNKLSV